MNPILKNVLVVIGAIIVGGAVNMAIIMAGPAVIPPPEGVDVMDPESLKESMHLFGPQHFLVPFLSHAVGTLVAALIAAKFAASRYFLLAMIPGAFFLLGGIANAFMLPAPMWFIVLDLVGAYFPMAWLGYALGAPSASTSSDPA